MMNFPPDFSSEVERTLAADLVAAHGGGGNLVDFRAPYAGGGHELVLTMWRGALSYTVRVNVHATPDHVPPAPEDAPTSVLTMPPVRPPVPPAALTVVAG